MKNQSRIVISGLRGDDGEAKLQRERKFADIWTFRKPKHTQMSKPVFLKRTWTQTSIQSAADVSLTFSSGGDKADSSAHRGRQPAIAAWTPHAADRGDARLNTCLENRHRWWRIKAVWRNGVIIANRAKNIWIQRVEWPTQQSHFYDLFVEAGEITQ